MDTTTLVAGAGIGLFLAAPVGPIGITCIRYTLAGGMVCGLAAGLGAATGHALLSGLAVVGAMQLARWTLVLRVIGGLVLLRLAWKAFHARPDPDGQTRAREGVRAAYIKTLLLQLATPANTILALLAYVSGLSEDAGRGWLVAGVLLGSARMVDRAEHGGQPAAPAHDRAASRLAQSLFGNVDLCFRRAVVVDGCNAL